MALIHTEISKKTTCMDGHPGDNNGSADMHVVSSRANKCHINSPTQPNTKYIKLTYKKLLYTYYNSLNNVTL